MSFVIAAPDLVAMATEDLAGIGASLTAANAAAAVPTSGLLAAAGDEVSAAIAALFSSHGQQYQAMSAQAAAFHARFVQALAGAMGAYAAAEAANASPLQTLEQGLLGAINAPAAALSGRPFIGNGTNGAPGTGEAGGPGGWLLGNGGNGGSGAPGQTGGAGGAAGLLGHGGTGGAGGTGASGGKGAAVGGRGRRPPPSPQPDTRPARQGWLRRLAGPRHPSALAAAPGVADARGAASRLAPVPPTGRHRATTPWPATPPPHSQHWPIGDPVRPQQPGASQCQPDHQQPSAHASRQQKAQRPGADQLTKQHPEQRQDCQYGRTGPGTGHPR